MDVCEGAILGAVGGILAEVYGLYQIRKKEKSKRPVWLSSTFYWLTTCAMIAVGAAVVALYIRSGAELNPLHLGAATPTLIGVFSKSAPDVELPA